MLETTGHEPTPAGHPPARRLRGSRRALLGLLGPAFVAAIAYVDPGNVAANLTAGAQYGYLLVWVLVAANVMAVLVQYQSAKLGIVTGKSLPEILGERLRPVWRRAFWVQAEIVAAATDLAEVVGGAVALYLLFGLPLPLGAVIVGGISMALLAVQSRNQQRPFEFVIMFLLGIITVGFLAGLFISPPDPGGVVAGLLPGFQGPDTVLLAASMLGATVMPHAIYVHSALSRDRHRPDVQHVQPHFVIEIPGHRDQHFVAGLQHCLRRQTECLIATGRDADILRRHHPAIDITRAFRKGVPQLDQPVDGGVFAGLTRQDEVRQMAGQHLRRWRIRDRLRHIDQRTMFTVIKTNPLPHHPDCGRIRLQDIRVQRPGHQINPPGPEYAAARRNRS